MTLCLDQRTSFYAEEDLKSLNSIPKHLAIIMDGNRRWAHQKGLPIQVGHAKGADNLKSIVEACIQLGIETLTVYSFSTENRRRTPAEIKLLFTLFKKYLTSELENLCSNNIRLHTIGDLSAFPEDLKYNITCAKEKTKSNTRFNLVLALNYGSRDEIKRAVIKISEDIKLGKPLKITEELISQYLDTANFQDPDLVIRTSGEFRLSNFLLWQISYSEIFFSNTLWPDFSPQELLSALKCYQTRKIRRGR